MKNQNVARAAQLEDIIKKEIPMEIQMYRAMTQGFKEVIEKHRQEIKIRNK